MKKIFTQEEIDKAANVNILSFCEEQGINLEQTASNEYRWADHRSMVIKPNDNYYYWNSRQRGGNTIRFAQDVLSISFTESMTLLLGTDYKEAAPVIQEERKPFEYRYKNNSDKRKAYDYLINERCLDKDIVTTLSNKGFIQQVRPYDPILKENYDAAAFVWGKHNKVVGVTTQEVELDFERHGKRGARKRIGKNVLKHFGFNVTLGEPKSIYFFESPIDLMSYWSLNKSLSGTMLVSLEGLKTETVNHILDYAIIGKGCKDIKQIYLAVDNDYAASRFCETYMKMDYFSRLVPFDNAVPTHIFNDTKEFLNGSDSNMPIEFALAIQKAMTNFSLEKNSDDFSNSLDINQFNKYFSKVVIDDEKNKKKVVPVSLKEGLELLSNDYKNHAPKTYDAISDMIQPNSGYEKDIAMEFSYKVQQYLKMYQEKGIDVLDSYPKDWNDVLKLERQKSLVQEQPVSTYINKEGHRIIVTYNEKQRTYDGEMAQEDTIAHFFEADSPQEAEQLAKAYGFHALDKEDQQKYFGHTHTAGTRHAPKEMAMERTR